MSAGTSPVRPESRSLAGELTRLLDASPDAVVVVDRSGTMVALNSRLEQLFGYPPGALRGRLIETLLPVRYRHRHAAVRAAYGTSPTVRPMSARGDLTGLRVDGTEFPVEIALTPVPGSPEGLVMGVVHEGTARALLADALAESARTAGALDAIADSVVTTAADGRVEFLNRSAEALTGWERGTARGRPLLEVLPVRQEGDTEPLDHMVARCLATGLPGASCEAMLPAGTGDARTLDISVTPIHEGGHLAGAAVVARDVTHARLIARQLSHQATHDALTGLVNRREFERRLGRALTSAAEEHAEHVLCFLDLDGFKQVNDACGHQAGDELLRQLSDVMRERMRSRDTLGRLGGDEFGLLLEHCRLATAERIAEEIRAAIEGHRFAVDGGSYAVGVSIGIVPIRGGGEPSEVLRAADDACYGAKRRGGNRIQVDDSARPRQEAPGGADWPRRVRAAIEQDRFRLHAQALVPLAGAGGGAPRLELLLRLDEGPGEPLLPGSFLPAARRHGLMPRVDRWVIRQTVRRLDDWRRAHPEVPPPSVAVNLGEESVLGGDVPGLLHEALAGTGLTPGAVCFEIDEAVAVAHPAATIGLLRELRAVGCRTALEHCGSGMAVFTLLRQLPVDYLKIAGHVVRGVAGDPVARVLATAINDVGHALGIATVAVEVETAETLACVRRLGVDYAQGFGIARPEPLEVMLDLLAAGPAGDRSVSPA